MSLPGSPKLSIALNKDQDGLETLKKSSEVWYSDGSVVLVADNVAFRVHISILAQNCEVFRDMDAIPKPEEVNDADAKFEGCPVLKLQDKALDVEHFLKAMYNFRSVAYGGVCFS
jgi:hypothetical protein